MKREIEIPKALHPETADLVVRFAEAMAIKLRSAEVKHGYSDSWLSRDWERKCQYDFIAHILKGDPVDVANYCAFMFHHGWHTRIAATIVPAEDAP